MIPREDAEKLADNLINGEYWWLYAIAVADYVTNKEQFPTEAFVSALHALKDHEDHFQNALYKIPMDECAESKKCKYWRDGYCGLRDDIRRAHFIERTPCLDGPCPDEKPMTNIDRVRKMTDEELADWLWSVESFGIAYGPRTKRVWLDWLRQEAIE